MKNYTFEFVKIQEGTMTVKDCRNKKEAREYADAKLNEYSGSFKTHTLIKIKTKI